MESFNIIKVNSSESNSLLTLSWKTFYESFNHLNTPENMAVYMNKAFTSDKLLSELFNPFSEFYFIKEGSIIMGYLKINRGGAQTDVMGDSSLEIERIYIDQDYQGRGIGAKLLEKAKERARELELEYVWARGVGKKHRCYPVLSTTWFLKYTALIHLFSEMRSRQIY
jgi:GNAT superfamily N-acetyltransferase